MSAVEAEIRERKKLSLGFADKEKRIRSQLNFRVKQNGVPVNTDEGMDRLRQLYKAGIEDDGVLLPIAPNEMGALAYMLMTGMKCVLPTCLDYAYKETGGTKTYTFDSIGDGVSANAKTLINKLPCLLNTFGRFVTGYTASMMLVSDVEATDKVYQKLSGLNEQQIRTKAEATKHAIESELEVQGINMVGVGLMGLVVHQTDEDFATRHNKKIYEGAKKSVGISRNSLYRTMFQRSNANIDFQEFMLERVNADLERYIALGSACRKKGITIVDATAPEVAGYYNIGADEIPVTPYIRVIDKYK